ncbi:uncharacterized protein LOC136029573 [Artemia franciscana]|uniref:Uncharacterized protein n=1 Tax=Artemia franciscana TaxID=6661 RepID=A0AA88KZ03_ARTSF|nr:hypothetical protein QYM36_014863 [Artemia franciscana]
MEAKRRTPQARGSLQIPGAGASSEEYCPPRMGENYQPEYQVYNQGPIPNSSRAPDRDHDRYERKKREGSRDYDQTRDRDREDRYSSRAPDRDYDRYERKKREGSRDYDQTRDRDREDRYSYGPLYSNYHDPESMQTYINFDRPYWNEPYHPPYDPLPTFTWTNHNAPPYSALSPVHQGQGKLSRTGHMPTTNKSLPVRQGQGELSIRGGMPNTNNSPSVLRQNAARRASRNKRKKGSNLQSQPAQSRKSNSHDPGTSFDSPCNSTLQGNSGTQGRSTPCFFIDAEPSPVAIDGQRSEKKELPRKGKKKSKLKMSEKVNANTPTKLDEDERSRAEKMQKLKKLARKRFESDSRSTLKNIPTEQLELLEVITPSVPTTDSPSNVMKIIPREIKPYSDSLFANARRTRRVNENDKSDEPNISDGNENEREIEAQRSDRELDIMDRTHISDTATVQELSERDPEDGPGEEVLGILGGEEPETVPKDEDDDEIEIIIPPPKPPPPLVDLDDPMEEEQEKEELPKEPDEASKIAASDSTCQDVSGNTPVAEPLDPSPSTAPVQHCRVGENSISEDQNSELVPCQCDENADGYTDADQNSAQPAEESHRVEEDLGHNSERRLMHPINQFMLTNNVYSEDDGLRVGGLASNFDTTRRLLNTSKELYTSLDHIETLQQEEKAIDLKLRALQKKRDQVHRQLMYYVNRVVNIGVGLPDEVDKCVKSAKMVDAQTETPAFNFEKA